MPLQVGSRLGPYEILAPIASGGMGEVWRARDVRLGREVAVKVLPDRALSNPEALPRFEQEMRAVAALSHPNILSIFDIGEEGSLRYAVTELLEGETLRALVTRGAPLSLAEILGLATQIVDGLAAAHARGIVHRDLKPENVFVTTDGLAKILDFGVARMEPGERVDTASNPTQVRTDTGIVLGTVGYMSPEQVKSQPLDPRSDLFAFGCLLYELLARRRAFEAASPVETMMSILSDEPPPLATDPPLPTEVERLLARCLAKRAADRFGSAKELASELRALAARLDLATGAMRLVPTAASPSIGTGGVPRPTPAPDHATAELRSTRNRIRRRRFVVAVAAGAALLVLAAAILFAPQLRRRAAPLPSAPPAQLTTNPGLDVHPSFSPDGKWIAFASDRGGAFEIRVRRLAPGGEEIAVTSDGEENVEPVWSPDGARIAFHSKGRGGIWTVAAFGGAAKRLTPFGSRPAWSPDGRRVAFQSAGVVDLAANALGELPPSVIWVVGGDGSGAHALTRSGTPPGGHGSPAWTADGSAVGFVAYDRRTADLWTVPADGGEPRRLLEGKRFAFDPAFAADGSFVYFGQADARWSYGLFRAPLARGGRSTSGEAEPLGSPGLAALRHLAVSRDGRSLAWSALAMNSNLWTLPLKAGTAEPSGEAVPLTMETGRSSRPSFSPDGSTVAFDRWRPGTNQDIFRVPSAGGAAVAVTTAPEDDALPGFFPDGLRLAFLSERGGRWRVWSIDLASGRERVLWEPAQHVDFARLSPDGTRLAFNSKQGSGTFNLWVVPVDGHEPPRQLTNDPELLAFPCWSPDGRHLAAERKRGENAQVVTVDVESGVVEELTSAPGQAWPHSWSPDGRRIAFAGWRDGFWNVWSVDRGSRLERPLTRLRRLGAYVRFPAWSPRGDRIVYELAETTGNVWTMELGK